MSEPLDAQDLAIETAQPTPASEEHEPSSEDIVREILKVMDPDAEPVTIRSAYRDLSCKQSGPECYRRIKYPAGVSATGEALWAEDRWPECERLPGRGIRASERRSSVNCEVPPGTFVIDYERQVYHGSRGKCKVSYGIVYRTPKGKGDICWLERKSLRSRPVDVITLPNGQTIEIARREHNA